MYDAKAELCTKAKVRYYHFLHYEQEIPFFILVFPDYLLIFINKVLGFDELKAPMLYLKAQKVYPK